MERSIGLPAVHSRASDQAMPQSLEIWVPSGASHTPGALGANAVCKRLETFWRNRPCIAPICIFKKRGKIWKFSAHNACCKMRETSQMTPADLSGWFILNDPYHNVNCINACIIVNENTIIPWYCKLQIVPYHSGIIGRYTCVSHFTTTVAEHNPCLMINYSRMIPHNL